MEDSSTHQTVTSLVESHLEAGQEVRFWVTSNSMHPCLQIGDALTVERIKPDKIKIGDLLVVQRPEDTLTHRVIQTSKKRWLTKGDNNLLPDPIFPQKVIIGQVTQIHRKERLIRPNAGKWKLIHPLTGRLSCWEWKAFTIHRFLRFPLRLALKVLQKFFMR
jgi:signal peptidase I